MLLSHIRTWWSWDSICWILCKSTHATICRIYCMHMGYADFDTLRHNFVHFSSNFLNKYSSNTPVSQLWNEFKSTGMCEECYKHIPVKPCSTNFKQPWRTPAIKRLCRNKQRQCNIARLSNDPMDWATYYYTKKLVQQECRKAWNKYVSDLVDEKGNISTRLWSYIKSKRTDLIGVLSLVHDDNTYSDSLTRSNILNNYFSLVFTKEDTASIPSLSS